MALFSPRWKFSRRIEYSGCDQAVYQQDIVVHRTVGTDYEETSGGLKIWHVFVGPRCRSDYGDLRFSGRYGAELAYYLWPDHSSESARVCVRLEGADQGGALTAWYGNPSVETTSDGDDVYILFDHFDGDVLDTDIWGVHAETRGTLSVSDSEVTLISTTSTLPNHGIHSLATPMCAGRMLEVRSKNLGGSYAVYAGAADDPYYRRPHGDSSTDGFSMYGLDTGGSYVSYADGSSGGYEVLSNPSAGYHQYRIGWESASSVRFLRDGAELYRLASTSYIPDKSLPVYFSTEDNSNPELVVDYVLVRAYSATPPSLLRTSRGIVAPSLGWLAALAPSSGFSPTPANLSSPYQIRTHVLQESPYQICLPTEVENSFHIYLKALQEGPYQVVLASHPEVLYSIPGGAPLRAVYSILADLVLEYRIHIDDQVFRPDCFWDLSIVSKLNQLPTAHFNLLTAEVPAELRPLFRQGKRIRILYNDIVRFTGEIRNVKKDDMTAIWTISCEGGAALLADDSTEEVTIHTATAGDQIVRGLLPSTEWIGEIDPAPPIDYKVEYGNVLMHIQNVAQVLGRDWQVREIEDRFQPAAVSETTVTATGANWEANHFAGRYLLVLSGPGKYSSAKILSNTTEVLTLATGANLATKGVRPGDQIVAFGPFVLDLVDRLGSQDPAATLRVNSSLIRSERNQDIERVRNRIVVTGASSVTQDRNSVISGCTLAAATLATSEAVLLENLDSSQTTMYVDSTEGYPSSGTVLVDQERIAYASKSSRYFLDCARGYGGTTPKGHNIQTDVVMVSEIRVDSTEGYPSSGAVWIGMEKIGYAALSATSFRTLTRGKDGTPVYAHKAGILVRDAAWTDEAPEPGSSVELNGVRKKIVPALGVNDQNTLDRVAQEQLLALQDLREWGTGLLGDTSFKADVEVGDMIEIEEADGLSSTAYRLVGLTWRQSTGLIEIDFGDTEEYFLEEIESLKKGVDIANARGAVAALGTVTSVSSNGEVALVQLDTGESVWCRIK